MWKKVVGPTILVSLLWIAGSRISTYYVHRVYNSHSRVLAENVSTMRASWAMQDALWRIEAVVMEASGKDRHETRIEVAELEAAFQRHLDEAEKTSFTPEEQALVKAVREHFAVYRDHIETRLKPAGLAGLLTPQTADNEKTIRLARAVAEPCRQLSEVNERMLADSTLKSMQLSTWVNFLRLVFLIAGPILGVLYGFWVARGLNRSISQISVTLKDATGDLDREVGSVELHARGDLPGLQQQVQVVAGRMRQVMEELQHTRRQAMSAERLAAVGELAAGIAHELRNPLTSVKLLVQTAQRQVRNEPAGKQLQVAQQEIARLESTIQGLLDFARPPELHRVPHDVRTTVRRALNLVEGRAKQQRVSITEQMPDSPVTVDGDPEQLHQMFVNLLLNGIEAMPQGGTLEVAIKTGNREAEPCRVSVSDSGTGIPQSVLDRIFEPFVTSKEHGTGLGLAVSHRIAAEHCGTLLAANRPEGGAVFTVELPVSRGGEMELETHGNGKPLRIREGRIMPKLLVIDDEAIIRFSIVQVFANDNIEILCAETAEEGLRLAEEQSPDLVLLDIRLGNRSGLDVFHDLRRLNPKSLIIFMTGHGTTETAIEAMKLGAYDYLVKPLDADQLQQVVSQAIAISRLMNVPTIVDEGDRPEDWSDRLIGSGAAMQAVCKQIGRVAPQDVNVLILGESGTGKELVARAIYQHSRRSQAPFLAINCAAIPEPLLESELFGHERGAFTGADRRRVGKFEQSHEGTLLLDEIGDMASGTQAKILRLLQEKSFERVGGSEAITADVRVIAATNQDLDALIERGRFRKDLYYRLRGVTIHLPPLRERREDIAELAYYFLFRYNRELGTAVQSISREALELLEKYDWPGNVRQLQSVIREALIVSAGSTIIDEFLPVELRRERTKDPEPEVISQAMLEPKEMDLAEFIRTSISRGETDVYRQAIARMDRLLIACALEQAHGHQIRAAEILGLSRATLRTRCETCSCPSKKY